MKNTLIQVAGWYGMIAVLAGYTLLSFSIIDGHSFIYQFLNLTGGLGIAVQALSKKAYPAGALNVVWALVAAYSIVVLFLWN